MCGIVGFVSRKPNEELIKNMVNSINHRGPDESNYQIFDFEKNSYTLAHQD